MEKFRKSYIKGRTYFNKDTKSIELIRVFEIGNYKFELERIFDDSTFIEVSYLDKGVAVFFIEDKLFPLSDLKMLEIANAIINYPVEYFAFQNGVTEKEENGYLKITDKHYLTNADPIFDEYEII